MRVSWNLDSYCWLHPYFPSIVSKVSVALTASNCSHVMVDAVSFIDFVNGNVTGAESSEVVVE